MSSRRAWAFAAIVVALLALWILQYGIHKPRQPLPTTPAPTMGSDPSDRRQHPGVRPPVSPVPPPPSPVPRPASAVLPVAPSTVTFVVPPGQEGMHRELIPKHITIVRCYYDAEVVAPGMTFEFDLNGSGFDDAFHRMITVDPDALDVTVKNLRLVTANQLHGQIEVGPGATTQYIYLKVMIRGLPVFKAPDPFGVVRRGEVLDIQLTSIDEGGQWGRFRVITNLDPGFYPRFHLEPTDPRLEVSNLKLQAPFYVDGVLMIGQGLKHGQYGLIASMGKREIFRRDPLVDVVKPTVGRTGSIEKVTATEPMHRPGDRLELAVYGSGFSLSAPGSLSGQVPQFEVAGSSFTYVSPGRLQLTMPLPSDIPVGIYGIHILSGGKVVYEKASVFGIVPPNWLAGVKLAQPMMPGGRGQLIITGRDISPAFAAAVEIQADEPGLGLSGLRLRDSSALVADIRASTGVAPGDYLIHVSTGAKDLKLPKGNIIKINPYSTLRQDGL